MTFLSLVNDTIFDSMTAARNQVFENEIIDEPPAHAVPDLRGNSIKEN